ncbi:glycosyltransferase [Candidatus Poribacteria bacterium]|nr:glycosyltransferase [Candidatus Poribacteria bacterium]
MHQSSFNIVNKFRDIVDKHFNNTLLKILDVGSYGVNGTYKEIFSDKNKYLYTGLDLAPGPNVDFVPKDPYSWNELEPGSFDVIISGQTFEHIEFPWLIMEEMENKIKPNGLICLIAPSRGPEHKYPLDCWRYYPDGFCALAKWVGLKVLDVKTVWGSSGFSDGSDQWGDTFAIMHKDVVKTSEKKIKHTRKPINNTINRNNPLISSKKDFYYAFERNEIIEAIIKNRITAKKVLEIGCATGATGKKLINSTCVDYYVGIELSEQAAKIASQHLDKVIVADIEKTDLIKEYGLKKDEFDLLLALDVLEHLNNPWDALATLTDLIKTDGHVIASIPNVQNIAVVSNLLKGKWKYEDAGILDATHLRFFTLGEIEKMFVGAGLCIEKSEYILNPRIDTSKLKEKGNNFNHENFTITNLTKDEILKLFTYQYLIIAKKGFRYEAKKDSTTSTGISPATAFDAAKFKKGLVSIVILTFNQIEYTKECIDSIIKHTPESHEIIFIDNGSTDGTVEWIKDLTKKNKKYKLIDNGKNLGFARGSNQGITASSGEYILLLNNDVVVTENWLSGMLECLNRAPDIGFVGPMSNYVSGPQKVINANFDKTDKLQDYASAFRNKNRNRQIQIRRIVGFCMLMKRSLAGEIGLLDESFGSGNFEDDDYCLRAALAGCRNLIAGDVFIHHYGSKSFSGNNIDYKSAMEKNKKIFLDKWNSIDPNSEEGKKVIILNTLEKANELVQKWQIDKAVSTYVELIKLSSEKKFYYTIIEILINANRFEEAIKYLNSLPETDDQAKKSELIGYCKEGLGLYNEAEEYADKAIALNNSAFALNLKGMILFRKGQNDEAEKFFIKAIEIDKRFGEPYSNLGVLRWTAGKKPEALDLFEKAFIISPIAGEIATNYHDAIINQTALKRAKEMILDALALYPNNVKLKSVFKDIL